MSIPTLNPLISRIGVPDAISNLPGWLCWRFEPIPNSVKQRKVPVYIDGRRRHGRQGTTEDRARLVTYTEAVKVAMARGWGVGFAPMPEWGITALDFDNCVSAGQVHPDVNALIAGTYAELSPSGRGVRAFVVGQLGNRKDAHGTPFGIETFSGKGFVTCTGAVLDLCTLTDSQDTIAEASPELLTFCAQRFGRAQVESEPAAPSDTQPLGLTIDQLRDALDVLPDDLPYEGRNSWISIGMAIHHETSGSDEGFELWDDWSSRSPKYSSTEYGRARWDSFGRNGQHPVTAHALITLANENGARIDTAALEADEFDVIPDTPESIAATQQKADRFKVIDAQEFADQPLPTWLVRDVLPKAELVVLFGESTAGKSFVALDLAMAIARGVPWRGKRVQQGRVAYVVAEGKGGFSKRLRAYAIENKTHDQAPAPLGIIPAAPNLMEHGDAVDVCKSIVAWGGADVVIVDTFAQTMPGGNENAGEDVGKALANCKGIHRATGAVVVLVHHAGKDTSKGARGWSGLKAAADAEIEVTRSATGRAIRTSKQKDGEDGVGWGFDLKVVQVGMDDEGEVETSCVVIEAELPAAGQVGASGKARGPVEAKVVEVVSEFAESQTSGIEVEAVVKEVLRRWPAEDGKRDTRRQRIRRALGTLTTGDDAPYFLEGDSLSIV